MPTTEALHHTIALLLTQIPVKRIGIITIGNQVLGYFLGLHTRTAEDNPVNRGVEIDDPFESKIALPSRHKVVDMANIAVGFVLTPNRYLFGIVQIAVCNGRDLSGHRGREKKQITLFGNLRKDGFKIFAKAHIEHLISLV